MKKFIVVLGLILLAPLLASADDSCKAKAQSDYDAAIKSCDAGTAQTQCNYYYQINQVICGVNCQYFYQTNEVKCPATLDQACNYYYQVNSVVCGKGCQYYYQTNEVACPSKANQTCNYYYQINRVICGNNCQYFYQTNEVRCVDSSFALTGAGSFSTHSAAKR